MKERRRGERKDGRRNREEREEGNRMGDFYLRKVKVRMRYIGKAR